MMYFAREDSHMLQHTSDVMRERIAVEVGYEEEYVDTMDKLSTISLSVPALVVTGDEQTPDEAQKLFQQIVRAELEHWVPNASQRLLSRAALALGTEVIGVTTACGKDCGADPAKHSLVPDWVAGIYVRHCVVCHRLYDDGMRRHA